MSGKKVSEILKELRAKAGLSAKEVYERLGVKQARFSAWETGKAEPGVENLLALCKIYGVDDVLETFGYTGFENNAIELNFQEQKIIEQYRSLSSGDQEIIENLLSSLSAKTDIIAHTKKRPFRFYNLADIPENGTFDDLQDHDLYTVHEVTEDEIPEGADFGVLVPDNSMEPLLSKGDVAFFEHFWAEDMYRPELYLNMNGVEDESIYLISLDRIDYPNETLIRFPRFKNEYFPELIPANRNWQNTELEPIDTIKFYGKLVGKLNKTYTKSEIDDFYAENVLKSPGNVPFV